PVIAIPCTKKSPGLRVNDIDLFEINEKMHISPVKGGNMNDFVGEINLQHILKFVVEKDEGLSWIAMMDTSASNMSYQALERDQPEVMKGVNIFATIDGTTPVDQMEKNDGSSSKPDSRAPSMLLKMITEHVDRIYMILMALGSRGCVANGLSMSLVMLVLSRMTNGYASLSYITTSDINQVATLRSNIQLLVLELLHYKQKLESKQWKKTIKDIVSILAGGVELSSKTLELESLILHYTNRVVKQMSIRKMRKALDDCRMATYLDPGFLKVCLIAEK
nr:DnaJ homolog subfamily C member 7-like [Tanacetum cinerariifolium]